MRNTITTALKMTAARIAECGEASRMTLSLSSTGNTPANIAGMMAKYFATSFAIENVVREPRVIKSCFPISTISISFVGSESRSTMLPASFAAWDARLLTAASIRDGERRPTFGRDAVRDRHHRVLDHAALLFHPAPDGIGGALADLGPLDVHAAHARLRRERDELGVHEIDGPL